MASRDERDDMYATESVFNGCRENIKAVIRGNSNTLVPSFIPTNLFSVLFRSLINEQKTIIAVMHDLNLVAQYADRVLLLSEGRLVLQGQPNEVFQREPLREIYGVDFDIWQNSQGRLHIMPFASAVA